jgi:hypothetical protein
MRSEKKNRDNRLSKASYIHLYAVIEQIIEIKVYVRRFSEGSYDGYEI